MTGASIRIRRLAADDLGEWGRMRRELWPDCDDSMHDLEMLALEQGDESDVFVIAEDGRERLLGFIELSVRARVDGSMSDRVGYVEGWWVDEQLRGTGWGRRLIEAAERWTLDRGLDEIASDAEIANTAGIAAHHAVGFRETFRVVQFLKKLS